MSKSNPANNAKSTFDTAIAPLIRGTSSDDAIQKFSQTSFNYFYQLPIMATKKERQRAAIIGFKDEYFVETIINHVIRENQLENIFYCKKVTANATAGIKGRTISINGQTQDLTYGGDCVIFTKHDHQPILIVECKEYIDMIRMKELIGESRVIIEQLSLSTTNFPNIKLWVFAEVLELTSGWAYLFANSNLKHHIDKVFIVRDGKRKDKNNQPKIAELTRFRDEIKSFLLSHNMSA